MSHVPQFRGFWEKGITYGTKDLSLRGRQYKPFLPPALRGRGDVHRLAIFGDCAASNVDACFLELGNDAIVGQHINGASLRQ